MQPSAPGACRSGAWTCAAPGLVCGPRSASSATGGLSLGSMPAPEDRVLTDAEAADLGLHPYGVVAAQALAVGVGRQAGGGPAGQAEALAWQSAQALHAAGCAVRGVVAGGPAAVFESPAKGRLTATPAATRSNLEITMFQLSMIQGIGSSTMPRSRARGSLPKIIGARPSMKKARPMVVVMPVSTRTDPRRPRPTAAD